MSDRDFSLEIDVSEGFKKIESNILFFPISIEILSDEHERRYLYQNKVSMICGIVLDEVDKNIHRYEINSRSNEKETNRMLMNFSGFFKAISVPHRITEISHELDWDKEVISYKWKNT